jgi:hypothetical protein
MPETKTMTLKTKDSLKFRKWSQLYLNSSNPEVFGNATECAARVYNVKNRASAANIGYENVRKLDNLVPQVAESLDFTLHKLLKELYEKAKTFNELERFIVRLGYFPSEKEMQMSFNQQNNHYDFSNLAEDFARARKERGLPVFSPLSESQRG